MSSPSSNSRDPVRWQSRLHHGLQPWNGLAECHRAPIRRASVVINYANSASVADDVVKEIAGLGQKAIAIKADISKPAEIVELFEKAIEYFGRLDIVVSTSGVEHLGEIEDVTAEGIDRVFAVNTRGQFLVAQHGI